MAGSIKRKIDLGGELSDHAFTVAAPQQHTIGFFLEEAANEDTRSEVNSQLTTHSSPPTPATTSTVAQERAKEGADGDTVATELDMTDGDVDEQQTGDDDELQVRTFSVMI